MKNRRFFRLFALCCISLALALGLLSCAPSPPNYLAYQKKGMTAEVKGELFGSSFCAKMTISPQEAGYEATITYLSLGATQDLSLSALYASNGEPTGKVSLTLGTHSSTCAPAAVQGMLSPVTALLSFGDPASVLRESDRYVLRYEDGSELTLKSDGTPSCVHTKTIDFWVVWWENAEKTNE